VCKEREAERGERERETVTIVHKLGTHLFACLCLLHAKQGIDLPFKTLITDIITSVGERDKTRRGENLNLSPLFRVVIVATVNKKHCSTVLLVSIHSGESVHPSDACYSKRIGVWPVVNRSTLFKCNPPVCWSDSLIHHT